MKKSVLSILIMAVVLMYAAVGVCAQSLVFDPAENENWYYHGVFYGRGIELKHGEGKGNIYLTCEYYYKPGKWGQEHFPVFESTDGGNTFNHISDIYDTEFTKKKYKMADDGTYYVVPEGTEGATTYHNEWWSMLYQPTLFELSEDLGDLKKGTVLCVGTTRANNHCAIVIYYSTDNLRTWKYLSTVAEGGKCEMEKASAIWEGFLILEDNTLYCFYSDERGMTGGGQRLVVKKSKDAVNWSEDIKVCDFEQENERYRPGMPIVTKMPDGRFLLTYEGVNMGSPHPGYYKITDDLEKWDIKDHGTMMPRLFAGGSPYCTTLEDKVIIGSHGTNKLGFNTNSLANDDWIVLDTNIEVGYSRSLFSMANGNLLITSGGNWNVQGARKLVYSIERFNLGEELTPHTVTGSDPWGESEPNWDNGAKNVIDDDPQTFFDGQKDGYVIIDLGEEKTLSAIGYMPRFDFGFRMRGGEFYASKDGENWTRIHTVEASPQNSVITYVDVKNEKYRYVKYNTNGEEFCSVAAIRLYEDKLDLKVEKESGFLKIEAADDKASIAAVYNSEGKLLLTVVFKQSAKIALDDEMHSVKIINCNGTTEIDIK